MANARSTRRKCIRLANGIIKTQRRINKRMGSEGTDPRKALKMRMMVVRAKISSFRAS